MIIFFHGLGSSNQTNKFTAISDSNKVCLTVNHEDPKTNYQLFDHLISKSLKDHNEVILVGHSFGAFWAKLFAKKYNLKALLINPSLWPSLLRGKLSNPTMDYISELDKKYSSSTKGYLFMLVEMGDELIDFSSKLDEMKKEAWVVTWPDGHHRFSRLEVIDKYLNMLKNHVN